MSLPPQQVLDARHNPAATAAKTISVRPGGLLAGLGAPRNTAGAAATARTGARNSTARNPAARNPAARKGDLSVLVENGGYGLVR